MITINSCLKWVILILSHSKFYFDSETQISVEVGVTVTRAHSKTDKYLWVPNELWIEWSWPSSLVQ